MRSYDDITRRGLWKLGGLTAVGLGINTFFDGLAWQDSKNTHRPQSSEEQITRGTYNADQLREIESCLEGQTEFEGLDKTFGELLNDDEGRTLRELEYVFDETAPSSGVSSSIRYTVEVEGGGTHELGWFPAQNSDVEILAEASTYDDLSDYEEENCR